MVVGSMASMTYGEPRMTHDLDLVVDLLSKDALKIETIFPANDFYCPPPEILQSEVVRRGQFKLIHHETGLKIDMVIRKESEHAICEFDRRQKVALMQGFEVYMATPEDVIIKKLDFYRMSESEKH